MRSTSRSIRIEPSSTVSILLIVFLILTSSYQTSSLVSALPARYKAVRNCLTCCFGLEHESPPGSLPSHGSSSSPPSSPLSSSSSYSWSPPASPPPVVHGIPWTGPVDAYPGASSYSSSSSSSSSLSSSSSSSQGSSSVSQRLPVPPKINRTTDDPYPTHSGVPTSNHALASGSSPSRPRRVEFLIPPQHQRKTGTGAVAVGSTDLNPDQRRGSFSIPLSDPMRGRFNVVDKGYRAPPPFHALSQELKLESEDES